MKVVFRVDASTQVGSGHLMRCLTLAEELNQRGVATRFICGDHLGNLNDWIQGRGIAVTELTHASNFEAFTDAEQTIYALNTERPDWIVIDHYGLDIEWEQQIRPFVERLMVIDDFTGRHHDCDVLLDQNYSVEGDQRYFGLVPSTCRKLIGPAYALLRKEFRALRKRINRGGELDNILVFFTAGDDRGETLKAMRGIEMFAKAKRVDVVVGRANPHNLQIQQKCEELHWGYHCQVEYMPSLIAQADLVVGAGGSSNWERCALGAPTIVSILADNQAPIADALDKAGAVTNLGWWNQLKSADYEAALSSMDVWRLAHMSAKAMQIVDAAGAERVADALLFS